MVVETFDNPPIPLGTGGPSQLLLSWEAIRLAR